MRLTIPCRALTCSHLQCFDATLYIQMNEKKPTWVCPVCDKKAPYEHLIIDGWVKLQSSPKFDFSLKLSSFPSFFFFILIFLISLEINFPKKSFTTSSDLHWLIKDKKKALFEDWYEMFLWPGCSWRSWSSVQIVMRSSSRRMDPGLPWDPRRRCRRWQHPTMELMVSHAWLFLTPQNAHF